MPKKTYTVTVAVTGYAEIEVEASSFSEAENLALKDAENGDLNQIENIEWNIAGISEK